MGDWKRYLEKAGGGSLLKQYIRNHTLGVAINQFVAIGRDKKALELLRLAVEYKFLKRLRTKERSLIDQIAIAVKNSHNPSEVKKSKIIWICWWQGIENAPELVKKCYSSICYYFSDWDIRVITSDNYLEYVDFPDYIIEKWKAGKISNTHMSDLLRLELLIKHGGLWLDSTIMATSSALPKSIINSDLFFYQTLKPGADGHSILLSSWLIYAKSNNCILKLTRELLYNYWKKAEKLSDYFLLHYYMTIACEIYQDEYDKIPQFSNEIPHILLLNLFKQYNQSYMDDLNQMTCFHKLSYKLDPDNIIDSKGSYYDWIMNKLNYDVS